MYSDTKSWRHQVPTINNRSTFEAEHPHNLDKSQNQKVYTNLKCYHFHTYNLNLSVKYQGIPGTLTTLLVLVFHNYIKTNLRTRVSLIASTRLSDDATSQTRVSRLIQLWNIKNDSVACFWNCTPYKITINDIRVNCREHNLIWHVYVGICT